MPFANLTVRVLRLSASLGGGKAGVMLLIWLLGGNGMLLCSGQAGRVTETGSQAVQAPLPPGPWRRVEVWGVPDARQRQKVARALQGAKEPERVRTQLTREFAREGWAEASIDRWEAHGDTLLTFFHLGPRYLLDSLSLQGLNEVYVNRAGFDRLNRKTPPLNWDDLNRRLEFCLNEFQNEGYPFAAFSGLQLSYRRHGADTLMATVDYSFSSGPLVRIDSIRIQGNKREKDDFVYSLIRLSPGDPFTQKYIDAIPRVLNNSIYYQKVGKPELRFSSEGSATLSFSLERQRSGKFDLLLGILPSSDPADRRLEVTGLVDVVLVSPFRMGELLEFKYNKLTASSQELNLRYQHPNLFRTRVTVGGAFHLFANRPQQEDAFLNRDLKLTAAYPFSPFLSAQFFFRSFSTGVLDTTLYQRDSTGLPSLMGGGSSLYGGGFTYDNLDYRRNPTRGLSLYTSAGLGSRKATPDKQRTPPETLATILTTQPVQEIELTLKGYFRVFRRQVLLLANQSYFLNQKQYYLNDLRQIGGGRSIRGFDENQFFTHRFTFFTLEYRLLLDRNSYIFAFTDYAYLENAVDMTIKRPLGLGLGLAFDAKGLGILSLTYAVGRLEDQPFRPSRGKIHIGLVNQF